MKKRIKIGDSIQFGSIKAKVVGILYRGKGYREYDCTFFDKDGEPAKSWVSEQDIELFEKRKLGF